jgi:hypothetical protein
VLDIIDWRGQRRSFLERPIDLALPLILPDPVDRLPMQRFSLVRTSIQTPGG